MLKNNLSYEDILNQNAFGIFITTPQGKVLDVNNFFCEMLKYNKIELLKKKFYQFTHTDDLELLLYNIQALLKRQKKSFSLKLRYVTRKKNYIHIKIHASLIKNKNHNTCFIITFVEPAL